MGKEFESFNSILDNRYSCRAFLKETVPLDLLEEIIATAQKVPSWCNAQPWQLTLVEGERLEILREKKIQKHLLKGPEQRRYVYICPCVSSAAARLVRDYKRVQVPFQLKIIRGVTTLGKETYIDAVYSIDVYKCRRKVEYCAKICLLIQSNWRLRRLISEGRHDMEDGDFQARKQTVDNESLTDCHHNKR